MALRILSMNKNQFRQGDILIEVDESIPKEAVKAEPEAGRVILAKGEVTFHDHSITSDKAEAWKIDDQTVSVVVKQKAAVKHQEHAPIPLKRGIYKVTRQREYSPEAIRNVQD